MNEISIDQQGNCTVVGQLAHALWTSREFPRVKCCANNYYVLEPPAWGGIIQSWDIKAAQSTLQGALRFMDSRRVLVDVSNAPAA